MPLPLMAAAAYWLHIARRPIDLRLRLRHLGGFTVTSGAVALVALWLAARPAGIAGAYFWGELAGVQALYLMFCSLLLATRLARHRTNFGGLDRMYTCHKRTGICRPDAAGTAQTDPGRRPPTQNNHHQHPTRLEEQTEKTGSSHLRV